MIGRIALLLLLLSPVLAIGADSAPAVFFQAVPADSKPAQQPASTTPGTAAPGAAAPAIPAVPSKPLVELTEGARVALIGSTFIEREQYDCYLESLLLSRFPGKRISVRNFGYAGDTVETQHRPVNFGPLEKHLTAYKPTLILVGYGSTDAFDGPAGIDKFIAGYRRILDLLTPIGAKIVLVTPHLREEWGPPLPETGEYNKTIKLYAEAIKTLGAERSLPVVDLAKLVSSEPTKFPLTLNSLHLRPYGYWQLAQSVGSQLKLPSPMWQVQLDAAAGKTNLAVGTTLTDTTINPRELKFTAKDALLPTPPPPVDAPPLLAAESAERFLTVKGLSPGKYSLLIDGKKIVTQSSEDWATGVRLLGGPEYEQVERLRAECSLKNLRYFYRWRPHNGEYVYGRRSAKAPGNAGNPQFAAEMAEFDRLVSEGEGRIVLLASPTPHSYQIIREAKDK